MMCLMTYNFHENAWQDYLWFQQNDKQCMKRINELIKDIVRNGYEGIGKPEPLKYELQGWWSRRITKEHRLVYRINNQSIDILMLRFHY